MNPAATTPGRRARLRCALLLTVAAALSAVVATPAGAEARGLQTGVTNVEPTTPIAFAHARAAGTTMVRIPIYWGGTAPREQPPSWNPANPNDSHYAWGASDDAVRAAIAQGLTPILQVDGAPQWAQRCSTPPVVAGAVCDPNPAALGAFASAVAARYSGRTPGVPRVKYFQALNEPNLSTFFFPQFSTAGEALSPGLYRDLINAFYAGVKAAEPNALVLLAGLGPVAVPQWTIGPMSFARALLCMKGGSKPRPLAGNCGGGVHFDIFAMQPYTTGGPTHEGRANDVQIGDLPKLQRLIRAADRAKRIKGRFKHTPLWITEFSWDSKPPDPNGLPMKIETRWVAEALHTAWSSGVEVFLWYSLRDEPIDTTRNYGVSLQSGLYFRGATVEEDKPKPFMRAFRFPFVAYPGKLLRFWGRTPNSGAGKVAIQVLRGGKWKRLAAVKADRQGIFRGRIATSYGRTKKGAARAVYRGQRSAHFSMKPVADFRQPPFG